MSQLLFVLVSVMFAVVHGQHASCREEEEIRHGENSVGYHFICDVGGYILPGNFNSSQLPIRATWLDINARYLQETYLNVPYSVAHDNAEPLPHCPNMTGIRLRQFNRLPTEPRFPLHHFLQHNRQIGFIQLWDVKLLHLTGADVRGFSQLEHLWITRASLVDVSRDTFQELGVLSTGSTTLEFQPSLSWLHIEENPQLVTLDWAFLKPISQCLRFLGIVNNGLQTLNNSAPFALPELGLLDLSENNLTAIPRAVLSTLKKQEGLLGFLRMNIGGQTFCPASADCGCCEMRDLAQWLQENGMHEWSNTVDMTTVTCGRTAETTHPLVTLLNPKLHAHCV